MEIGPILISASLQNKEDGLGHEAKGCLTGRFSSSFLYLRACPLEMFCKSFSGAAQRVLWDPFVPLQPVRDGAWQVRAQSSDTSGF